MQYLHVILPVFFLPVSFVLVLIIVGVLRRRRWMIWAGIALLWLASTPLVSDPAVRAAERWAVRGEEAAAPTADAIVVLSGGLLTSPQRVAVSDWQLGDRFYSGLELFREGKAPFLLFTGSWLPWQPQMPPEGDINVKAAQRMGVPAEQLLTTGPVSNTAQEAQAIADTLRARRVGNGKPRVLLVTAAYHMPRAQMLFQRAGIAVVPFPVDFRASPWVRLTVFDVLPSSASLRQTELAWREMYGRLFYWVFR